MEESMLQESDLLGIARLLDEKAVLQEHVIISRLEDTEEFINTRFEESENRPGLEDFFKRVESRLESIECRVKSVEARLGRME